MEKFTAQGEHCIAHPNLESCLEGLDSRIVLQMFQGGVSFVFLTGGFCIG